MSIPDDMISASKTEVVLTERLIRLTEEEASWSVTEYEEMGKEIRGSKEFSRALIRALALLDESCSTSALELDRVRELLGSTGFVEVEIVLRSTPEPPESLRAQDSIGVVPADLRAIRPVT